MHVDYSHFRASFIQRDSLVWCYSDFHDAHSLLSDWALLSHLVPGASLCIFRHVRWWTGWCPWAMCISFLVSSFLHSRSITLTEKCYNIFDWGLLVTCHSFLLDTNFLIHGWHVSKSICLSSPSFLLVFRIGVDNVIADCLLIMMLLFLFFPFCRFKIVAFDLPVLACDVLFRHPCPSTPALLWHNIFDCHHGLAHPGIWGFQTLIETGLCSHGCIHIYITSWCRSCSSCQS